MCVKSENIDEFQNLFNKSVEKTDLSDKQKSVLIASLTLFSNKGFDNTSTKDIALMAGVSEGTVYKKFKTKKNILREILNPVIKSVIPTAIENFTESMVNTSYPNFETFLYSVIKNRLTFVLSNLPQIKILFQELLKDQNLLLEINKEISESSMNQIVLVIKYYQDQGQLVNWEPMRMIKYILMINLSYVLPMMLTPQSKLDIDEASRQATEFLIHGLTP